MTPGLLPALVLSFVLFTPLPAVTEGAVTVARDAANKINLSGRQRMLTQRIAKAACFAAIGVGREAHLDMLAVSRNLYARTLDGLEKGDAASGLLPEDDPAVLNQIAATRGLWQEFALLTDGARDAPTPVLGLVIEYSVPLLDQSDALVKALVASRGDGRVLEADLAHTIDVAGRQRMLSQRIAKAICAIQLGILPGDAAAELQASVEEFEAALTRLLSGHPDDQVIAPPTKAVAEQLDRVATIWRRLRPDALQAIRNGQLDDDALARIAADSDTLLDAMDRAVSMY